MSGIEKKGICQRSHWLSDMAKTMSDQQIATMYEEISEFRRTGILHGSMLRDFARRIQSEIKSSSPELRMAEDAVLFEMGRRLYERL